MNLLRERIALDVVPAISTDLVLTETTKRSLAEYCRDTNVHTELNLTFADLLTIVWDRVSKSVHSAEIKRVLNTEMNDSVGMCFTGRISRLVNCLNGFDPLVNIRISDSEQIGNVVAVVRTTLEERGEYTPEKHREIARDRLQELGISKDEIERWLSHIE
jgi:hypothetical protein